MGFDLPAAREILARICESLNRHYSGRYWITCGTLLGVVRDGDLLGHDSDLDLAMRIEDYDEWVIAAMNEAGLRLVKTNGTPETGLFLKFSDGRIKTDIYFCYREGERLWHAVTSRPPLVRYYYRDFGVRPMTFKGIELFVPDPPDVVLAANYGTNWRIPVLRWHYAYSAFNAEVIGGGADRALFLLKNGLWQIRSRAKHLWRGIAAL